jgi:phosphatidylglycerol lysyltransferase
VLGGAVVAVMVALLVVTALGQQRHLAHEIGQMYNYSHQVIDRRADHLHAHTEARLRLLFETLAVGLGVALVWSLFQPRTGAVEETGVIQVSTTDSQATRELLERYSRSSEDYFKLWPGGKSYFATKRGVIAYRVESGTAFALADPVAATAPGRAETLRAFTAFARRHGWVVCVLQVEAGSRSLYRTAGMHTMQIGSSAVIPVRAFQQETSSDKWWRWQRNRANRNGWNYQVLQPPHDVDTMEALRAVSDAWLTREGRSEQGFALGYFDEAYLQVCAVHVLRAEDGQIIAFANQLPRFAKVSQATVDLIRFMPDAEGAMPSLLMHIILGLDPAATPTFDLGFVPLARVDSDLARLARRLSRGRFAASGLEQFKNKFRPDWRPVYVAYDGDLLDLARVASNLEKLFAVNVD